MKSASFQRPRIRSAVRQELVPVTTVSGLRPRITSGRPSGLRCLPFEIAFIIYADRRKEMSHLCQTLERMES